MIRLSLVVLAAALGAATPAAADGIVRTPMPSGSSVAIASAVAVPAGAKLVFLSGSLATIADKTQPGDTQSQTANVLNKLEANLRGQGMGLKDVVKATAYLVGDPAKGGEIDYAGFNAAWSKAFGTEQQPNKPARTTIKVAGLVLPGALIEIEFIAATAP